MSVPSVDLLGTVSVVSELLDGFWLLVVDVCVGGASLVGKHSWGVVYLIWELWVVFPVSWSVFLLQLVWVVGGVGIFVVRGLNHGSILGHVAGVVISFPAVHGLGD